jgi:hypothetical protein
MKNKILKPEIIGLAPNSNKVKEYKNSLVELTKVQWEAAIGLMLGNANLQYQNKAYAFQVHQLFDDWVLSVPVPH